MPWITRALMTFAGTVRRFWVPNPGGIVILVAALGQYIKTEQGRYRYDQLRLRMPLFGPIYHKALISRFTRTLGTLLSCGVGVLNSLELTERVLDNVVMAQVVKKDPGGNSPGAAHGSAFIQERSLSASGGGDGARGRRDRFPGRDALAHRRVL